MLKFTSDFQTVLIIFANLVLYKNNKRGINPKLPFVHCLFLLIPLWIHQKWNHVISGWHIWISVLFEVTGLFWNRSPSSINWQGHSLETVTPNSCSSGSYLAQKYWTWKLIICFIYYVKWVDSRSFEFCYKFNETKIIRYQTFFKIIQTNGKSRITL